MLTGMSRLALFAIVVGGCSKSAGSQDKGTPPPAGPQKISVPGQGGEKAPTIGQGDDPKFHLQPDEGTLTIDKAEGPAGAEATAGVKVTPATGYHISIDFPIKLALAAPTGVKLAKAELVAGKGVKGDAETFSEQGLAFAVKATADKAGAYEISGTFKFGVCDKDSCHPKKQPISITVKAN